MIGAITLPPWIPKNQKNCVNTAINITTKKLCDRPNNGVCNTLYIQSMINELVISLKAKVKIATTYSETKAGIIDKKGLAIAGGTVSGNFIVYKK